MSSVAASTANVNVTNLPLTVEQVKAYRKPFQFQLDVPSGTYPNTGKASYTTTQSCVIEYISVGIQAGLVALEMTTQVNGVTVSYPIAVAGVPPATVGMTRIYADAKTEIRFELTGTPPATIPGPKPPTVRVRISGMLFE